MSTTPAPLITTILKWIDQATKMMAQDHADAEIETQLVTLHDADTDSAHRVVTALRKAGGTLRATDPAYRQLVSELMHLDKPQSASAPKALEKAVPVAIPVPPTRKALEKAVPAADPVKQPPMSLDNPDSKRDTVTEWVKLAAKMMKKGDSDALIFTSLQFSIGADVASSTRIIAELHKMGPNPSPQDEAYKQLIIDLVNQAVILTPDQIQEQFMTNVVNKVPNILAQQKTNARVEIGNRWVLRGSTFLGVTLFASLVTLFNGTFNGSMFVFLLFGIVLGGTMIVMGRADKQKAVNSRVE